MWRTPVACRVETRLDACPRGAEHASPASTRVSTRRISAYATKGIQHHPMRQRGATAISPASPRQTHRSTLGSHHLRPPLHQHLPQNRPMTPALLIAITPHRKIRMMRQRRKQIQFPAPIRRTHLPPELPHETRPCASIRRPQRLFHQPGARRKVGEPDVIVIELGEIGLWHAPRRTPHRAQT
jgi:hypothetical protein